MCKSELQSFIFFLGWWFVNVDEEQGWVPAAYLEREDGTADEQINQDGMQGEFLCRLCCSVTRTRLQPSLYRVLPLKIGA